MGGCTSHVICWVVTSILRANEIQLYIKWMEVNTKILRLVHQALSPAILHQFQSEHVASDLIKALKNAYGTQGLPQVYTNFKVMMEMIISANSHLGPTFAH